MRMLDLAPALVLALFTVGATAAARLRPGGEGPVLVRADGGAAWPPGAALVDLPAPGFAVLRGDLAAIRAAFGPAVPWRAASPCAPGAIRDRSVRA